MNRPYIDPAMLNKLVPSHSPEVVEEKMKKLNERMQKDFDKFLSDLENCRGR